MAKIITTGTGTERNVYPVVSAYSNPAYINTRFMGSVDADPDALEDVNQLPWFDPLDPKMLSLFKAIKRSVPHRWRGERITSISQQYFHTTSLWWVILMFNGYTHPDELERGALLQIPDVTAALADAFATASKSGQKITL